MGGAVRVDQNGVGDVGNGYAAGGGLAAPAGDGVLERGRDAIGFGVGFAWVEGAIGEEPEGVLGTGLVGGLVLFHPVDGDEGDQRMRGSEVDEDQAARRTEGLDAAVGGEVTVLIEYDLIRDFEELEDGVDERLVVVPEGLWCGEVIAKKALEAWIADEVVLAAVGRRVREGGEPGDVFAGVFLFVGELRHVELGVRRRRGEEGEGGELEVVAHWVLGGATAKAKT